jgi:hypothetical protein
MANINIQMERMVSERINFLAFNGFCKSVTWQIGFLLVVQNFVVNETKEITSRFPVEVCF